MLSSRAWVWPTRPAESRRPNSRTTRRRPLPLVDRHHQRWLWKKFAFPAYAYDRGTNIRVRPVGTTPWTDTEPMLHCTGQYPAAVEYDVELPVAAGYTLSIQYAAHTARPLDLAIDGKPLGPCCRNTTGGWNTSQAGWENAWTIELPAGKHTIRLSRDAGFPHLVSLRFESSAAFPQGWQLHRPNAKPLPAAPPSAARLQPNARPGHSAAGRQRSGAGIRRPLPARGRVSPPAR